MKLSLRLSILVVLTLASHLLVTFKTNAQTTISGVVNQYAKVTYVTSPATSPAKIVVNNTVFSPNDKVMIIQMKGATIDTSNSASFGFISALNSAGLYEFGVVNYLSGDTVVLKGPICNNYSVKDSVQLIKVAVYTSPVTVTGTLTCAPWANGVGGVLVIDASDSITLNADIDVSFNGFLGGNIFGINFNCGANDYVSPANGLSSLDGEKGEGIAQYVPGKECGRAPSANGGGGAGAGNTPAGGGGNYGGGGNGGAQWSGGGPQHDNGYTVYNGGNGGGIILIRAGSIVGNNHTIRSDGDSVLQTHDEGTSGGGAGGSIYIECPSYYTNVKFEAVGGKGGSVYNTLYPTYCHAPGGGGGGGSVWFSSASVPPVATVNIAGGLSGLVLNPMSSCYNTSDYATNGGNGGVLYNLPNPFFYPVLHIQDTTACTSFAITLSLDNGYHSYLWSTGDTTQSITVSQHGTYTVQAVTPLGCTVHQSSTINQDTIGLAKDTTICFNTSLILSPTPAGHFTSYNWQNGNTTAYDTASTTGEYKVVTISVLGCTLSDSVHVYVLTKPLLKDTLVCDDKTPATISLPSGYQSYHWSTGSTDSVITVTHSGTYTVHAITSYGCVLNDTAHVADDTMNLGHDTSICYGQTYVLKPQPDTDFISYRWQDFSTNATFTVTQPGQYYVYVKTAHNCLLFDSVYVSYYPHITVVIAGDSDACPGTTIPLTSFEIFPKYQWSTGDTTKTVNVGAGTYTLQVTTIHGCIAYDTATVGSFPSPMPYLGPDTAICFDYLDTLTLYPGPFKHYLWQDKSYAPSFFVSKPGTYAVTVTDSNNCQVTVDRTIENLGCPNPFFVPNAFTPNGDNLNDVFHISAKNLKGLENYELSVFNRWGQLVFHTFDFNAGWDGTYNHHMCDIGDYYWTISFTMLDAGTLVPSNHRLKGEVTLIR